MYCNTTDSRAWLCIGSREAPLGHVTSWWKATADAYIDMSHDIIDKPERGWEGPGSDFYYHSFLRTKSPTENSSDGIPLSGSKDFPQDLLIKDSPTFLITTLMVKKYLRRVFLPFQITQASPSKATCAPSKRFTTSINSCLLLLSLLKVPSVLWTSENSWSADILECLL